MISLMEKAARMERQGNYAEAWHMWQQAAEKCRQEINRVWAIARAEVCHARAYGRWQS